MIRTAGGLGRLPLAVAALAAVTLALPSSSPAGSQGSPSVAFVLELPSNEAGQARLATMGSVLKEIATPRLLLGVYLDAGPANGSELLYAQAPAAPAVHFSLPRPKLPADPTSLEKKAYTVALKQWREVRGVAFASTTKIGNSSLNAWALRHAGGLLTTTLRSDPALTCSSYAATLYRAGLFFMRASGTQRTLVIIADLVRCPPPSPRLLDYKLAGVRVILAGPSPLNPTLYRTRISQWRGFFAAEGSDVPVVLPHGLDTAAAISALVKR